MQIRLYEKKDKARWDNFVSKSKNATFLFVRDYMDYHSHRFRDNSLIVFNDNGNILALLPANINGDVLESHGGLTYGGFLIDARMTTPTMLSIFKGVLSYLRDLGFSKLIYKSIPHIYHVVPSEEDRYCLFRMRARLYRRDVLSVIDYRLKPPNQERRKRAIQRAIRTDLQVKETDDYQQFWQILTKNLSTNYGVKPVHTVEEIEFLSKQFPDEIKLFASYSGKDMLAGAVLYISRNVCHVQYNAASDEGKKKGALDIIMDYLIRHFNGLKRFFDFGISTEDNGSYLNNGLVDYKEGFGGRAVVHDFYEIKIEQ